MKYTEAQLEQAFISLLKTEGYKYINGKELTRTSNQEVLLKDDLRSFLLTRYPDLEEMKLESIINEIAFQSASNLYESNKYICKLLADGLIFKRNDPSKKDLHIRYVDIKAQLKMDIIVKLHQYGYPPITQDDVYKNVLEQAENFKKNII